MINKVTLIGNIGKTEFRDGDNPIFKFSLATNKSYKDSSGEWIQQTEWHSIVMFGQLAVYASERLAKGMLCYVEGSIHYNKFEDKDGIKRTYTDIKASIAKPLSKKEAVENETSLKQYDEGEETPF